MEVKNKRRKKQQTSSWAEFPSSRPILSLLARPNLVAATYTWAPRGQHHLLPVAADSTGSTATAAACSAQCPDVDLARPRMSGSCNPLGRDHLARW
jgi:hypothetical protein